MRETGSPVAISPFFTADLSARVIFFVRSLSPPRQYIGVHKSLDATLFLAHPRMKENMFFSLAFSSPPKNAGEGGERSDRPTIRQFDNSRVRENGITGGSHLSSQTGGVPKSPI